MTIRRWQPDDLVPRFEAIVASFEHLNPWMRWLAEPPTLDHQRAYGEAVATSWPTRGGDFAYGIFDPNGTVLGAIGLHDRIGPAALEITYWCHVAHVGRDVITRSATVLTEIALSLPGIDRVEIRCDAANLRSAAVPRRLGYRLDRTEPRERRAPADSGRALFWVKDRSSPLPAPT